MGMRIKDLKPPISQGKMSTTKTIFLQQFSAGETSLLSGNNLAIATEFRYRIDDMAIDLLNTGVKHQTIQNVDTVT